MEITTREFGKVQVDEDAIYEFPEGVYGFEDDRRFAVFTREIEGYSFLYLQSIDNLIPCFLVFEPWDMVPEYKPTLSREDMDDFGIEDIEELIFLVIATVPSKIEDLSINIKSPVLLNPKTGKAKQVILQNPDYNVRHYPFRQDGKDGSSC